MSDELVEGIRAQYLARLRHLDESASSEAGESADRPLSAADEQLLRRDLNALQRRTLVDLRERGQIEITTLRALERELDFQEAAMASTPAARPHASTRGGADLRAAVR
jgi:hypothetical protein